MPINYLYSHSGCTQITLTPFDLPLGAKQHLLAFRIQSGGDRSFGIRSTTVSLKGIDIQYAFFTKNDVVKMREAISK